MQTLYANYFISSMALLFMDGAFVLVLCLCVIFALEFGAALLLLSLVISFQKSIQTHKSYYRWDWELITVIKLEYLLIK